ncbi:MAG: hypothetical protein CVV18_07915 [Gammaproteobacteria bacterium HGW-Gammaproteobacteria-8]|nr:MAG: hypothetical protein CVV18_07915 [Gammaproteobacteria bacterium HGW-Gammaproteobacteria-8]
MAAHPNRSSRPRGHRGAGGGPPGCDAGRRVAGADRQRHDGVPWCGHLAHRGVADAGRFGHAHSHRAHTRASVARNKWAAEVKTKVDAAAKSVADTCKRAGISDDTADALRRQILGIAA